MACEGVALMFPRIARLIVALPSRSKARSEGEVRATRAQAAMRASLTARSGSAER